MEFANQRGDPNSAWSVGKHAKRSATIHLNSNDLVQNVDQHFTALVTGQDGAGLYFQDPGGAVRDAFATSTYTGVIDLGKQFGSNPEFEATLRAAAGARDAGRWGADNTFDNITQIAQDEDTLFLHNTTTTPQMDIESVGYDLDGAGVLQEATTIASVRGMNETQSFGALDGGRQIGVAKLFRNTLGWPSMADDRYIIR